MPIRHGIDPILMAPIVLFKTTVFVGESAQHAVYVPSGGRALGHFPIYMEPLPEVMGYRVPWQVTP